MAINESEWQSQTHTKYALHFCFSSSLSAPHITDHYPLNFHFWIQQTICWAASPSSSSTISFLWRCCCHRRTYRCCPQNKRIIRYIHFQPVFSLMLMLFVFIRKLGEKKPFGLFAHVRLEMRSSSITKSNCRRMQQQWEWLCEHVERGNMYIRTPREHCAIRVYRLPTGLHPTEIGSTCACLPIQCTNELKIQKKSTKGKQQT